MKHTFGIFRRELSGYFATPVAYVVICFFLALVFFFTFSDKFGRLYETGQADLRPFFGTLPWLYMLFLPAISMRLWAEERKLGTIELLMTLPVTVPQAVLGKFLAAWVFTGIALVLTCPVWITVNYLGDPDNTAILAGYFGSFLMAGGFLAIGSCVSALTKNQVIAFLISFAICLGFVLCGHQEWLKLLPDALAQTISSFSFLTHFEAISKGVIDLRNLVFFFSLLAFFLFSNALILDAKKAD